MADLAVRVRITSSGIEVARESKKHPLVKQVGKDLLNKLMPFIGCLFWFGVVKEVKDLREVSLEVDIPANPQWPKMLINQAKKDGSWQKLRDAADQDAVEEWFSANSEVEWVGENFANDWIIARYGAIALIEEMAKVREEVCAA